MDKYDELKSSVLYFSYEPEIYNFYEKMQEIFNCENYDLQEIHNKYDITDIEKTTFDNDTDTFFHKIYYNSPKYHEMISIYKKFISDVILPIFKEDLIVQKEPSFRIHLPENSALGNKAEQNSSDIIGLHCDGDYNHPREEINFMLSITGQKNTNSCFIETEPMKGDFFALTISKGQFISFYGNQCRHYNMLNKEGLTRISFDFRVIPKRLFKETDSVAIHSKRKFNIGGYYELYKFS